MRSIIMGVLFVIGGLSGGLVLRGTGSSGALAVVGLVMIVIGFVQVANGQSGGGGGGGNERVSFEDPERDREMMAEYERAKAANAAKSGQVALPAEIAALIASTPGAQKEIDGLLQRTKGH